MILSFGNALLPYLTLLSSLNQCNGATVDKSASRSNNHFRNSTVSSTKSHGVKENSLLNPLTPSSPKLTFQTSSTSTSSPASITPSTTVIANATSYTSNTITSAPPWGNQSIPLNTCSVVNSSNSATQTYWTPCHVFAGTVQLSYFPENSKNVSYPSTYYDSSLSITLTSPSIYMIVNTITGSNDCGPLGPTYATQVLSMDLTDVSTIPPYANSAATSRGDATQLTLSDLENCPTYSDISTTGAIQDTHPVSDTYNRCNPRLQFPIQLKRLGYPYWKHCGNDFYNFGIFDPPGAVPTEDTLFVSTAAAAITATTETASPVPTAAQDQASNTVSPAQQDATASSTAQQQATSTSNVDSGSSNNAEGSSQGSYAANTDLGSTSTQPSVVAVIGTNTISAVAGSSGATLPNGSTLSVGVVTTLTDSNGNEAVVSIGTSGVYVAGSDSSSTYYANPTVIASSSIGIATIAGQIISAAAGDSSIVIDGQTITSGGAAVTLSGTDNVVTLGSEGLVIQYSAGSATTHPLPSLTSQQNARASLTIAGIAITASASASTIVIGSQTLTNGGFAITLANDEVVSWGSSVVIVQYPGGAISTISLSPSKTSSGLSTSTGTHGVAEAIASSATTANTTSTLQSTAISSSYQISQSSGLTSISTPAATNAGERARVNNFAFWATWMGVLVFGA